MATEAPRGFHLFRRGGLASPTRPTEAPTLPGTVGGPRRGDNDEPGWIRRHLKPLAASGAGLVAVGSLAFLGLRDDPGTSADPIAPTGPLPGLVAPGSPEPTAPAVEAPSTRAVMRDKLARNANLPPEEIEHIVNMPFHFTANEGSKNPLRPEIDVHSAFPLNQRELEDRVALYTAEAGQGGVVSPFVNLVDAEGKPLPSDTITVPYQNNLLGGNVRTLIVGDGDLKNPSWIGNLPEDQSYGRMVTLPGGKLVAIVKRAERPTELNKPLDSLTPSQRNEKTLNTELARLLLVTTVTDNSTVLEAIKKGAQTKSLVTKLTTPITVANTLDTVKEGALGLLSLETLRAVGVTQSHIDLAVAGGFTFSRLHGTFNYPLSNPARAARYTNTILDGLPAVA